MPKLAAAFASSHSVMLTCTLEDWQTGFPARDPKGQYLDRRGEPTTYEALLARAPANAADLMTASAVAARHTEVHAAIARLKADIEAARLDALIVVGDDQHELFDERQMPSIGVYYGDTILNGARKPVAAGDWYAKAQSMRQEEGGERRYPVDRTLALSIIEGLQRRDFDINAMSDLLPGQIEGHAFSFIHKAYMHARPIPIVPVFLNTFYPPNQPTPQRCVRLGAAIREIVTSLPGNRRIGLLASGGLSHFQVEVDIDQEVIAALKAKDIATLERLDERRLRSGSSEIRNWLVLAGAATDLTLDWISYTPGYRSAALTGTGLSFASWK